MYNLILSENADTKWIELCAWCDENKIVTDKYICKGYKASHGICTKHRDEVLKETIEFYEKNGFGITNDDTGDDGLPIVRGNEPR